MNPRLLARALRLPFLTVSVLPYVFGAVAAPGPLQPGLFLLGLLTVACAHLAANLANDYGDARTGADARDPDYYGFFGGSKLIQQGVLAPSFYGRAAIFFGAIALVAGTAALLTAGSPSLVLVLFAALGLGLAYTLPPLRLSYRRLGEAAVFLLFGPACVAAGAAVQGWTLAAPAIWLLSLPFGFLAAAVLVANEVPDATVDALAGKRTWVGLVGRHRGWWIFLFLVGAALGAIGAGVALGLLHPGALLVVVGLPFAGRAGRILQTRYAQKRALLASSRLAVVLHSVVAVLLIACESL